MKLCEQGKKTLGESVWRRQNTGTQKRKNKMPVIATASNIKQSFTSKIKLPQIEISCRVPSQNFRASWHREKEERRKERKKLMASSKSYISLREREGDSVLQCIGLILLKCSCFRGTCKKCLNPRSLSDVNHRNFRKQSNQVTQFPGAEFIFWKKYIRKRKSLSNLLGRRHNIPQSPPNPCPTGQRTGNHVQTDTGSGSHNGGMEWNSR